MGSDKSDTFKFCKDPLGTVYKQIRASHAVGKFIVDSFIGRITQPRGTTETTNPAPSPSPQASAEPSSTVGDNLPVSEAEFAILSSADVVDLINRSPDDAVRAIGDYELAHRRRRLVVEAVRARVPS